MLLTWRQSPTAPRHRFVTGGGHTVILWDARLGAEILSWPAQTDRINSVAFSPDGRCVFSGGQGMGSRGRPFGSGDVTTLKPIRTLSFAGEVDASLGGSQSVEAVAVSPDGALLAVGIGGARLTGSHNALYLCDAHAGANSDPYRRHTGDLDTLAFDSDGHLLATADYDNTVKVWDVATGQLVATSREHTKRVSALAFRPGGTQIASGGGDGVVRLWDARTGQTVHAFTGHTQGVSALAFTPDGRTLLSAARADRLRLWDVDAGQELPPLSPRTDSQGRRTPIPRYARSARTAARWSPTTTVSGVGCGSLTSQIGVSCATSAPGDIP